LLQVHPVLGGKLVKREQLVEIVGDPRSGFAELGGIGQLERGDRAGGHSTRQGWSRMSPPASPRGRRSILVHVEDLETVFGEFRRVLKPGGRALIYQMTATDEPNNRTGDVTPSAGFFSAQAGSRRQGSTASGGDGVRRSVWVYGSLGAATLAAVSTRIRRRSLSTGVALVTGGSRGLGLLIARELAARGFRLAICARDGSELATAEADLAGRGAEVLTAVCDMADRGQVDDLVRSVIDRYGQLDLLVNNAGVIEVGPVTAMTVDDFAAAHDIMFWGPLYATLAALPQLRRQHRGRIINITSIGGKISAPHLLPYNCAKFAAVGLSEGLRAELAGSGVTVTTVVPGLMRTGSHLRAFFKGDQRKEFAWFAVAASLPGLSMNARRAARRAVRAGLAGRAELVLTPAAWLAIRAQALFPGATVAALGVVQRLLPAAEHPTSSLAGVDASSEADSRLLRGLTVLGRSAARRYHQYAGVRSAP
jgi:NAD(P)-dependent dehydrogenase (short-subunit alcohol dehydrogenase family)